MRFQQQGHQRAFVAQQVAHVGEAIPEIQDHRALVTEPLQGSLEGGEPLGSRWVGELVAAVADDIRDGAFQQRRQAVAGQQPFDLPLVDQRLFVQELAFVVGADIDAVQIQPVDNLQRVSAADQGLADGRIDEPFEGRHRIWDTPLERPENSRFSSHPPSVSRTRPQAAPT